MKVVADAVRDNSVASVVSAGAAGADLDIFTEDVDKFALALVAPLTSKHDRGHGWVRLMKSVMKLWFRTVDSRVKE